jgi:hypothetical protein
LAVEDTLLYQNGTSNWTAKQFASVPEADATDLHAEQPCITIKLATKSKSLSKNLTRMTPSSQEGSGGIEYPLTTDHWPLTTPTPSPRLWGTALHACFEQITWLEQGLPDRVKLLDLVMPIMQDANSAAQVVDAFYASCELPEVRTTISLATYRNAVPEADRANMRWEVYNERRFWASLKPDILLHGSIDRLVLQYDDSDSKPRVVAADVIDYKSGVIESDEMLGTLVDYYAPQLAEYRKAVAVMYGLTDEQITTRLIFVQEGIVKLVPGGNKFPR